MIAPIVSIVTTNSGLPVVVGGHQRLGVGLHNDGQQVGTSGEREIRDD